MIPILWLIQKDDGETDCFTFFLVFFFLVFFVWLFIEWEIKPQTPVKELSIENNEENINIPFKGI